MITGGGPSRRRVSSPERPPHERRPPPVVTPASIPLWQVDLCCCGRFSLWPGPRSHPRRKSGAAFPPFTLGSGKPKQAMEFLDKTLKCADCGNDFVFTAGEQLFFHDKQFRNDPKRCKVCKLKRASGSSAVRTETRTVCSVCNLETTVPFKPTQGRPVLCRSCFQQKRPLVPAAVTQPVLAGETAGAAPVFAMNAKLNA